jgi:2-keto-4-pentenoate hydratase/2-oxohepta-3-ene-1,7-dioic acid hydratase in catechol pathway
MRVGRVQTGNGPRAVVERDDTWCVVEDYFAADLKFTGEQHAADTAQLLAPVLPTVIVGISHNLTNNDHALPIQAFLKSPRTVAGPGDAVPYRHNIGTVNMEVELAIVIAGPCRDLTMENALDAVFGYTIGNDVTNAGQVSVDEKFTQVKNHSRYTPLGPWIETEFAHPESRSMSASVNGELRLSSSTSQLPSGLAEILVYVTAWMELGRGDVILSGAPNTSFGVVPGDRVDLSINGLGMLSNSVE